MSALDRAPRLIHGFGCVPWRVTEPGGAVMSRGENTLRFAPAGQLAEIVRFPGP